MSIKSNINNSYRNDLDGLRALAVVAVVINHFNKNILESGYLGVDIFFVISGYVITSSLDNKKFEGFILFISSFYQRRIKRLLPALIFYVFPVTLLIWLLDPSAKESLLTGISSIFGVSNLYLYSNSVDYFATTTELNPFTHTWSLALEEQFYLFFPILFWFSNFNSGQLKSKRNFLFILLMLSTLSLLSFIYIYDKNQPAGYFLMPFRFWEIAFGSISYIFYNQKNYFSEKLKKINPSLVVIIIVAIFFSPISFAKISTFSTVFLTSILMFSLRDGTLMSKFLQRKEILFIGKRSYSIYLWHWGVLSLSRWTVGIIWWTVPFQIILIILLSIFSYKYIENPFRNKEIKIGDIGFRSYLIIPFTSLLLIIIIAIQFLLTKYINRGRIYLEGSKKVFINEINPDRSFSPINEIKNTSVNINNCVNPIDVKKALEKCLTKNFDAKNLIAIFGDSISGSLLKLGDAFYQTGKFNVMNISYNAQIFPKIKYINSKQKESFSLIDKSGIYGQKRLVEFALKEINKEIYHNKLILVANDFNLYFYGRRTNSFTFNFYDEDNNSISKRVALEQWLFKLKDFVKEMNKKNINVIVLGSMPSFPNGSKYTCFYRDLLSNYLPLNFNDCVDDVISRRHTIDGLKLKKDILSEGLREISNLNDNFIYFDPTNVLCQEKSECKVYDGEKLISIDGSHYSNNAALKIYDALIKELTKKKFISNF